MSTISELRAERAKILASVEDTTNLPTETLDRFEVVDNKIREMERLHITRTGDDDSVLEIRGVAGAGRVETTTRKKGAREIEGRPDESLDLRHQDINEWVRRAAENGVRNQDRAKVAYADKEYRNAYLAGRLGLKTGKGEYRSLLEDTTNSGLAITPESWSAQVIGYAFPASVFGQLGCRVMPMATEKVHVPQFAAPPAFVATSEGQPIGLDNSMAFEEGYELNASGSYRNLFSISRELLQDHVADLSLDSYLAQQVSKSLALTVDQCFLTGSSLPGCPGLINESGFNTVTPTGYTSGAYTLTDTLEFSRMAEKVRNQNAVPNAFLSNVSVRESVGRLSASTYAAFWQLPETVRNLNWVTTANNNILPATETDGLTPALTGGSSSSVYTGPWDGGGIDNAGPVLGVRLDQTSITLQERFVEYGMVGFAVFARFSIRTGLPGLFYRTSSIATS